ncbi:DUF6707 family protein [Prevotella pallens]|uniref:DUF6707 family protein n=1 Tax=Prevotella pallens TaxID=60133 RepID=UPI001CB2799A|nr:DUF6707 family protein [Prevotella pallens]MBF1450438.1 hypothetical protein [Prevotella pallens]
METIFNVITSNLANKMPFKSLFKELGDVNINSEQKLKYLMFSAYCFYFDGDITHTKEILSDLVNYSFDGDYNKWTWIEAAIMLQLYLDDFNNLELKNKVLATLDYGNDELKNKIKKKAFARRANGLLLHTDEMSSLVNDKEIDFIKLIPYFSELIFIRAFGNGEKFSEEQLMIDLTSLEQKVKSVISLYR